MATCLVKGPKCKSTPIYDNVDEASSTKGFRWACKPCFEHKGVEPGPLTQVEDVVSAPRSASQK